MNGKGIHTPGPKGELIIDDSFYVIFNAYHESLNYHLPSKKYGTKWTKILDTSKSTFKEEYECSTCNADEEITVEGRSIVILKHPKFQHKNDESSSKKKNTRVKLQ
jgi:glycogen operon protein